MVLVRKKDTQPEQIKLRHPTSPRYPIRIRVPFILHTVSLGGRHTSRPLAKARRSVLPWTLQVT